MLPRLTGDGPGANRYDDPEGLYTVRYVAENLTGALVETMARFRPAPAAHALLASIEGVDVDAEQYLDAGTASATGSGCNASAESDSPAKRLLADVHDPHLLRELDKHPLVRHALDSSGLGARLNHPAWTKASCVSAAPRGDPSPKQ